MTAQFGLEPVGVVDEVLFVHRLEDAHQARLHQFIFQRRDAQRALLVTPRFGNVDTPHRLRPVGHPVQSLDQFLQVFRQVGRVLGLGCPSSMPAAASGLSRSLI